MSVIIPLRKLDVWCRDGRVCGKATLCSELTCSFKDKKSDVENGIKKCNHYCIKIGSEWDYSCFLPDGWRFEESGESDSTDDPLITAEDYPLTKLERRVELLELQVHLLELEIQIMMLKAKK